MKAFRQRGARPDLYYWQSSSGQEVDLVFEWEGMTYGLEVKSTATPTPNHAEGLSHWLAAAGPNARAALACPVEKPHALRPGVRAVPWNLP